MDFVMEGSCWKFGDNILNDGGVMTIEQVHKLEYDPSILAKYCMTGIDPDFPRKATGGDIIVAGRNFGKGQLHIQGPLSIKGLGIGLITESMTRSFFRLSVVSGVCMLPFASGIAGQIDQGDRLRVDFSEGTIENVTKNLKLHTKPLPTHLLDIISSGGELEWLEANYGNKNNVN